MKKTDKELAREVIELIINILNITHVKPEDVSTDTPIFNDQNELDLDSVDAIEIVVELQKAYGVRINDDLPVREILYSIQTIVDFLKKENATEKIM